MTAGLRVLEGPTVAGVGVDDVIVVEDGELFSIALTPRGIDLTPSPRSPVAHAVLLRFVDGQWQEEGGGEVRPAGRVVVVDAWSFELDGDVGVVDTVRRFDTDRYSVVRPRRVLPARVNLGPAASWWTAVHDDGRLQDVIWTNGPRLVPLTRGVPLDELQQAGNLDDGVARTIVQHLTGVNGRPVVCWDGLVRSLDPRAPSTEDRRVTFGRLVGMPIEDGEKPTPLQVILDRYQRARAVTVADVAAFVRSYDAAGYARHLAMVEELELWRLGEERRRQETAP